MSDPRILIFGTIYAHDQKSSYLAKMNGNLIRRLNPGLDVMLVDSDSPIRVRWGERDINLSPNIGHLSGGGRDGFGRAFCAGLDYAVDNEYDYVAQIDADILFAHPVRPVVERMCNAGVMVAAPMDFTYQFIENGLMFYYVPWLRSTGFTAAYDWENSTQTEFPERKVERLCGDDLFILPYRGLRNDRGAVTPLNMRRAFPFGLDYITHAEFDLYRAFLALNGLEE